ncbi:MAG TPA: thiamine pyrophosphate-requiring protein [Stellaceae bacterium]|jgi:thiamine pyrophosphate-dependent acetolactate synthase large subunit-like protein|nr:thiamine pyrophosphate-requiring protein [Stellaceae bacterium]
MLVMDAITEILRREGISTMFCFPTTPIIEAAVAGGMRPVICRQERVGVHMADGCARVMNGKPAGVFAMQYGPGAENAFAGIASAYSDSTPILLLPLGHPRDTAQMFPLFNSTRTYASVTKHVEPVTMPEHAVPAMRRAFNALKNGRPGPVMLEIPTDVMTAEFAGNEVDYTTVRQVRSAGDERDIDDAAKMLIEAKSPIVIAGQGVLYAEACDELVALADLLDIPVMTTTDGKSAFPEDHALALGSGGVVYTGHGRHFLLESDVIFAIGTSLTRHNISTPIIPPGKTIIHATNDTRDFYKANDTAVPILGDAKLVLAQLIEAVKDRLGGRVLEKGARHEIARLKKEWLERWHAKLRSHETPINPYFVMSEFIRVIPSADAIVTHDSGSPRDQLLPFYQAVKPRGYLGWGKSHQLGTGLGLAIGAKVGAPDKMCVNFMGDAAFGMTGLDFETAARSGIPITTIVLNNSTMAIETHAMAYSHEKYRTRDLGGNYANLGRDLGGKSERVTHPGDVAGAITRARRHNENGDSCLLEFITSAETAFSHRRGAA